MTIGHCKHGEFILDEGCPQCIAERQFEKIDGGSGSIIGDGIPAGGLAEAAAGAGADVAVIEIACHPHNAMIAIAPDVDADVLALQVEVQKVKDYAVSRVVATLKDAEYATDDLAIIGKLEKSLEALRNSYQAPLRKYTASINEVFKTISDPLGDAKKLNKDKVLAFKLDQIRKQQEAEAAARLQREADEAARRVREETGEIIPEQEEDQVIVPDAVSTRVHADLGTSGIVKNWRWELADFTILPEKYKTTDDKAIKKVVDAGGDIPGIRSWQVDSLRVTPRKRED